MNLQEIYNKKTTNNNPVISFEVFPPKENIQEKNEKLIKELTILKKYSPELISITYGAGGTTKQNTLELTKLIEKNIDVNVMPHFTCINATKEFIHKYIKDIESLEIENILALRGDIPKNEIMKHFDFKYANELVGFIKKETSLSIGVAGYPECHQESKDIEIDIDNLKKKIDAGAQIIYTQLFFNNENFCRYVEKVRKARIEVPIIPGILPITNYSQLTRMISVCGTKIPTTLLSKLEQNQDDKIAMLEIGKDFATKQSIELKEMGVKGLHFFILNKSNPINDILASVL